MASAPTKSVVLGLDCSTQSLKATAVVVVQSPPSVRVVYRREVRYDRDLPRFGTTDGMHVRPDPRQDGVHTVTAPPAMWVAALDLLLQGMHTDGFEFGSVRAISGSAQQHGSVYLTQAGCTRLASFKSHASLASQATGMFSVASSPIWADSSTTTQCHSLEAACGGAAALAAKTGSRAYERFTANQIAKIAAEHPAAWTHTHHVALVSSFMASVLVGALAPIDYADGAGMNLMNLATCTWDDDLMKATAPGLAERLPAIVPSHSVIGSVASYFVDTFGFSAECRVVAWSGDNPCSLAGLGIGQPGDVGVSLGTSDTMFGILAHPRPGLQGHVFRNPVDTQSFMAMLCYKNGSLTRELVRDDVADGTWERFEALVADTAPGNGGRLGLYFPQPEITPHVAQGGVFRFEADSTLVTGFAPEIEARAVIESRFLSMRLHASSIGLSSVKRIIVTGGASSNGTITQIMADVFGVDVWATSQTDAASLGAALRAYHGMANADAKVAALAPGVDEHKDGEEAAAEKDSGEVTLSPPAVAFLDLLGDALGTGLRCVARSRDDVHAVYSGLIPAYAALERRVCAGEANT